MSIENRVETLEHELKILKNEIESTLLEIQNQVLVHYYPAFRAEETITSRVQLPFVEVPASRKSQTAQGQENASSRAGMAVEAVQPKTQEVSLDVLNGKPHKMSRLLQQPPTRFKRQVVAFDDDAEDEEEDDSVTTPPEINPRALTRLARWVNDSVAKIGKTRTQEMIEASAGVMHGTPAISDALRQLLDLSDEEEPPEPVNTKEIMDVLLKLNKTVDYVASVIAA